MADGDKAKVESIHSVAADALDVGVGEVKDLVVVQHHHWSLAHNDGIHLPIDVGAQLG